MAKPRGRLPNLLVIGVAKCGTSGLHYYLSHHPEITMSACKEPNFFIEERNWKRGFQWYTSQFRGDARVFGESSQAYSNFPRFQGVAQRIAEHIPDVKMIYLVRDPIDRAVSHYVQNLASGKETRSLSQALRAALAGDDAVTYLSRGRYCTQLRPFLDCFDRSQLLVITSRALHDRRLETLQKVFRFLGVDPEFSCQEHTVVRHPSSSKRRNTRLGMLIQNTVGDRIYRHLRGHHRHWFKTIVYGPFSRPIEEPEIAPAVRAALQRRFSSDVKRLEELTGQSFSHWPSAS